MTRDSMDHILVKGRDQTWDFDGILCQQDYETSSLTVFVYELAMEIHHII